ncbi:hypothetical protein A3I25_01610 [Candidatus Nomurabacteria bacterium RIFCSPLOWO2_02_FULL_42_17]|uniref:Elongation factor P C-terminal domain-containing protein n=2 Tax=Candidatus Nomuraibacteriota TaxID=1752729 RepID=A0A1F6WIK2_9BACT|nr:MAG: Elongation factor P [Parcubacteria group bacterium GW2011_GWA2_42_18]OGI81702.1 MAG: hypothetical protein A3B93_00835 [Candidatus Nomurabacteria bacterium RIFCSPHIGHO2_02_FULL_42_24]OGI97320.1 MAG: hypothetical protein A3I25_01610 [Candidatus Nomurabacteria bacterium RIFCSPLOWO2_02_FULL_42_17]
MLEYNEIKEGKVILYENEPYGVLTSHVFRKQQRKPVNQTKLKNLLTGRIAEVAFHVSEKVDEAEINSRAIKYLYKNKGEFWFCEENNPSKRFALKEEVVGASGKFLKENMTADLLTFVLNENTEPKIVSVRLPIKVDFKVTEAPPGIKGDTASGGGKPVTLETGAIITAPLFINAGDTVRVNTQTGEYTERV